MGCYCCAVVASRLALSTQIHGSLGLPLRLSRHTKRPAHNFQYQTTLREALSTTTLLLVRYEMASVGNIYPHERQERP